VDDGPGFECLGYYDYREKVSVWKLYRQNCHREVEESPVRSLTVNWGFTAEFVVVWSSKVPTRSRSLWGISSASPHSPAFG
jgi:hypothetical protein